MTYEEIEGVCQATVAGQRLWLHPFRAAYWEAENTLLIADLHLGKAAHFRREGIPVPSTVSHENWDRLIGLLLDFQPKRVLLLGDLFHSDYNREWEEFRKMVEQFNAVAFELILGNHDSLPGELYEKSNLTLRPEPFEQGPFLFSHHPLETPKSGLFNIAGHIHPCVFLQGSGRLRERLPCFYFGAQQGIMPAFGAFTGMAKVHPKQGEQVFVIAEQSVIEV